MSFFGKGNHQLDRRWMQQKTEGGDATVAGPSYPRGGKERRDFSPAPPGGGWAARRAKSRSSCSTLWITHQRTHVRIFGNFKYFWLELKWIVLRFTGDLRRSAASFGSGLRRKTEHGPKAMRAIMPLVLHYTEPLMVPFTRLSLRFCRIRILRMPYHNEKEEGEPINF